MMLVGLVSDKNQALEIEEVAKNFVVGKRIRSLTQ